MKEEKEVIVIKIEEDVKTWEKVLGFGIGIVVGFIIFAYYFDWLY